jgi:hypothetical protein
MRREFFIFATKRTETDEQGERRSRRTPQTPFSLRKHVSSEKYSTVKKIKNVQSVFFDSRTALRYISPLSPLRRSRAVARPRSRTRAAGERTRVPFLHAKRVVRRRYAPRVSMNVSISKPYVTFASSA